MSIQKSWAEKAKELKSSVRREDGELDYDVVTELLAAKKMASPGFAGDYERALDSSLLDIALASGDFG